MSQIFHTSKKEIIKAAGGSPQPGIALDIPVFAPFPDRRVYVYLEVNGSGGYALDAQVLAFYAGKEVGALDCSIGDFTGLAPGSSLGSVFNAGGSPVGDSYVLRLAQPFTTTTAAVLQPFRFGAEIDRLALKFQGFGGASITGWRAFLCCISQKQS